jgi:23S rRNA (guanosine2251-2'-O)-methyltransferase
MIVYGKQTVLYLLEHHASKIDKVYLSKEVDKDLYHKMMQGKFELIRTKPERMQQMCSSGNHQGFLAEVQEIELAEPNDLKNMNRVVVLAGLTDVGNMGAIIRSSYALGIDALVIGGIKKLNIENIVRSSSGAIFDLPIVHIPNLNDLPNMLKQFEFTLYGAAMQGVDVKSVEFAEKSALFVGSEGEGLSNRLAKMLDTTVSIQMAHNFDSLNVSVATAILIHEMR